MPRGAGAAGWAAALILAGLVAFPGAAHAAPGPPCSDAPIARPGADAEALRTAEEFDVRPGHAAHLQAALFPAPRRTVIPNPGAGGEPLRSGEPTVVDVDYKGFGREARVAFEHAVEVWKTHLASPLPITIEASFVSLGPGILGGASPAMFVREREGKTPWYPVALAGALLGRPLLPGTPDIVAGFNDDPGLWYFGVDGRPPPDKYDFASVVLHELGHGFGLTGDFAYENGIGSWGAGLGDGVPTIFDSLVADGAGRLLVDTYRSGSAELGRQLVSGSLTFAGAAARRAMGGTRPPIFSPSGWTERTSLYHLAPTLSPPGTPDALMSPTLGRGIAVRDAGPVVDAIFRDLGWPAAPGATLGASSTAPPVVAEEPSTTTTAARATATTTARATTTTTARATTTTTARATTTATAPVAVPVAGTAAGSPPPASPPATSPPPRSDVDAHHSGEAAGPRPSSPPPVAVPCPAEPPAPAATGNAAETAPATAAATELAGLAGAAAPGPRAGAENYLSWLTAAGVCLLAGGEAARRRGPRLVSSNGVAHPAPPLRKHTARSAGSRFSLSQPDDRLG